MSDSKNGEAPSWRSAVPGQPRMRMARRAAFDLTLIHPAVGRHPGMRGYLRTWQMEPLPAAMLSALTPPDVERRLFDDRMETIPFDRPTDLVAISVETYTARRAYQIASEYRRRGVPVVMGGFHATLCPDEVERYADSVVVGEAEEVFPELLDDYRHGRPRRRYEAKARPALAYSPDRSIFAGKRYVPLRLVEFARGCRFRCDFCAVQSFFQATQTHRPVDRVVAELEQVRQPGRLVFFIDDNLISDLPAAKELMRALIPLRLRWVSQTSINVAFDDEALELMRRSGCQGVLVGFESLDAATLKSMNKGFNTLNGGAVAALERFRRHRLRIYGTFVFGYDGDTAKTFDDTLRFAEEEGLFIAAFNHITPFPGTPLYERLRNEGRLIRDPWWLDPDYRYGQVPFRPKSMSPEELAARCLDLRRRFYSWRSIGKRSLHRVHLRDPWMLATYFLVNAMHHGDVDRRDGLPLGDLADVAPLLEAA